VHRRHREDIISNDSVRICQESIEQCMGCIEGEFYFEFKQKTESLRTLENFSRRALSKCKECTKGNMF
jgi:hypothetical protein